MYAGCLRAAGCYVDAVADGEKALFVASVFEPDVMVMDLRLPVVYGLEATRRMKASEVTRRSRCGVLRDRRGRMP
jgi:CheY-like chemotaxis protein